MSKLKFSLALSNTCSITIQDITGYVSTANPDGFIEESEVTIPTPSYKISNGYFKNIILYNKYGHAPVIVNNTESFQQITDVEPVYQDNFPAEVYALSQDGVFTIKRIFVITEEFYDAEKAGGRFDNKKIYYSDGVDIYYVENDIATKVTTEEFIDNTDPFVGMISTIKIVSTCFINTCYFNLINALINYGITVCPTALQAEITNQRDYLYMVLEAIKYHKEQSNTIEIQRIIEATNTCGGICKAVSTSDCGCNG